MSVPAAALAPQAPPAPRAEFIEKVGFLFEPHRYKVLWGGRGSVKSWSIARALLIKGVNQPLRILCGREIQKSLDQSVHKLLCDQIAALNLGYYYKVLETSISTRQGTEFTFHGLKHNIGNIPSIEGTDIAWVEEAIGVSKDSWEKLTPTIRKPGSEIWASFNPRLETDKTYQRFVKHPPKGAKVQYLNWRDNPWLTAELRFEKDDLQARDPDAYLNVWEGQCIKVLKGAVYEAELREAYAQRRVCQVPYDTGKPVDVACDLGWSDSTSLWFTQRVAMQRRMLRSYQNQHKKWSHYLKFIQDCGYVIGTIYLPHDGANEQVGADSIKKQTSDAGYRCIVVPRHNVVDGINAARESFGELWFDEESCAEGLNHLSRYVWDHSKAGLASRVPKHDEASHYADGLRTLAMGLREGATDEQRRAVEVARRLHQNTVSIELPPRGGAGWMGQ